MIGGHASSRRAEEFEAAVAGRAPEADRERYADLLSVVGAMRAVPAPAARPEYVAALRGQLVRAAADMPKTTHVDRATELRLTPTQRRGGRGRRIAAVLGGFAVVAASGSMAVASQSALPGDVLYPVKRAIENAHANLQSSDEAKASVLLGNAENRLSEVEALSNRGGQADSTEITNTLQAFKDQTSQASAIALNDFSTNGDDTGLAEVRTFAGSTMDRLAALDDVLPSEARPALIAAAQTVRSVDSAAFQACPTCSPGRPAELPDFAASQPMGAPINVIPSSGPVVSRPSTAPSGAAAGGATQAAPSAGASVPGSGDVGGGSSSSLPSAPSSPSTSSGGTGVVSGTVDKITKQLLGGSGTGTGTGTTTQSGSGATSTPSGDIVGDVTGILGLNGG